MTTLTTRPGQGLNASVYADRPLEGYTVTVEFADQGTFSSVDLTKTPTAAGREVVINLSSTEVDLIKNSRFRVRATKSGSTKTVATGVVNYGLSSNPRGGVSIVDIVDSPEIKQAFITVVGTRALPLSNANTIRPTTTGVVYWICAAGVTPVNAVPADLIWNAS